MADIPISPDVIERLPSRAITLIFDNFSSAELFKFVFRNADWRRVIARIGESSRHRTNAKLSVSIHENYQDAVKFSLDFPQYTRNFSIVLRCTEHQGIQHAYFLDPPIAGFDGFWPDGNIIDWVFILFTVIFRPILYSVIVNFDYGHPEIGLKFLKLIRGRCLVAKLKLQGQDDRVSNATLMPILNGIRVTWMFMPDIKSTEVLNYGRHLYNAPDVTTGHANWLTPIVLEDLHCKRGVFKNHRLNGHDLNDFLKRWTLGFHPNLDSLEIRMNHEIDADISILTRHMNVCQWDRRVSDGKYLLTIPSAENEYSVDYVDLRTGYNVFPPGVFPMSVGIIRVDPPTEVRFYVFKQRFQISAVVGMLRRRLAQVEHMVEEIRISRPALFRAALESQSGRSFESRLEYQLVFCPDLTDREELILLELDVSRKIKQAIQKLQDD